MLMNTNVKRRYFGGDRADSGLTQAAASRRA